MKLKDYFAKSINWEGSNDAEYPYKTVLEGKDAANNLYTLIVDDSEIDFDEWPSGWCKTVKRARRKSTRSNTRQPSRLVKTIS